MGEIETPAGEVSLVASNVDDEIPDLDELVGAEGRTPPIELSHPGEMTPAQYRRATRDLVNFLAYASEPAALQRRKYGVWVILFLALFTFLAYLVKKEYWKDVH